MEQEVARLKQPFGVVSFWACTVTNANNSVFCGARIGSLECMKQKVGIRMYERVWRDPFWKCLRMSAVLISSCYFGWISGFDDVNVPQSQAGIPDLKVFRVFFFLPTPSNVGWASSVKVISFHAQVGSSCTLFLAWDFLFFFPPLMCQMRVMHHKWYAQ